MNSKQTNFLSFRRTGPNRSHVVLEAIAVLAILLSAESAVAQQKNSTNDAGVLCFGPVVLVVIITVLIVAINHNNQAQKTRERKRRFELAEEREESEEIERENARRKRLKKGNPSAR